jgi:tetratricopeptide (TPR) repeat protein
MMAVKNTILAVTLSTTLAIAAAGAWAADTARPSASDPLEKASKAVYDEDYQGAIAMLNQIVANDPNNADAYNYLGFSYRKLGQFDKAKQYYGKALEIDPEHVGANEYLGELYLEIGDLPAAEERLKVLDDACFFGCDEYNDLEMKIQAYKKQNGQG